MDDSDYEVLNLLAHSYRLDEQYDKAVEIFQKIVDQFPEQNVLPPHRNILITVERDLTALVRKTVPIQDLHRHRIRQEIRRNSSQPAAEQSGAGDTTDTQNTGETGADQNGNGGETEGTSGENGQ